MKKNVFYLALIAGTGVLSTGYAQNHGLSGVQLFQKQHVEAMNIIIPSSNAEALNQQKPTEMQQRLSATTISNYDGVFFIPKDSISMNWSGTNKGDVDYAAFLESAYYTVPSIEFATPKEAYFSKTQNINFDSSLLQKMNIGLSAYEPMTKAIHQLDANGRVVEKIALDYNGTGWEPTSKDLFSYNASGDVLTHIKQSYSAGTWNNSSRKLYEFDANGNLTQYIITYWDDPSSSWRNSSNYTFSYNAQNKVTTQISQMWNTVSGVWQNSRKYDHFYDAAGNDTASTYYNWNNPSSQWVNSNKFNYTYNSNNQILTRISRNWDGITWKQSGKIILTYTAANQIENNYNQTWNGSNWVYLYNYKYNYTNNNPEEIIASTWNASTSSFETTARLLRKYNANNMLIQSYAEQKDTSGWIIPTSTVKFNFYYEEFDDGNNNGNSGSGIDKLSEIAFSVYPNPAKDALTIKADNIDHIKIVDLSGKVVFESKAKLNAHEVVVPTSQFANGLYFIQLQSNNAKGVKSFTVQH